MSFFSRRITEPHGVAHSALEIPSYRLVLPRLMMEVERARRFEHPFTVVVVSPHVRSAGLSYMMTGALRPWSPEAFPEAFPELFVRLGTLLRTQLRTIDVLATRPDAQSYLLGLVETSRPGAELLVERFRHGFQESSRVSLETGIAEFPQDGMTLDDLLDHAGRERREHRADDTPRRRPRTSNG